MNNCKSVRSLRLLQTRCVAYFPYLLFSAPSSAAIILIGFFSCYWWDGSILLTADSGNANLTSNLQLKIKPRLNCQFKKTAQIVKMVHTKKHHLNVIALSAISITSFSGIFYPHILNRFQEGCFIHIQTLQYRFKVDIFLYHVVSLTIFC